MNPKRAGLLILFALHLAVIFSSLSVDSFAKGLTTSLATSVSGYPGATNEIVVRNGVVSPMDFGAVGNGTADDYPALLRATDYAFANGLPIDGGDRVYGTCESRFIITDRTRPHIQRLRLKQLDPKADTVTLGFENCEQIRIDSLYIHTGNSPGVGSMESAYGLRVVGGTGHRIRNVEATGKGKLSYVQFNACKHSTFENIYVHDTEFHDTSTDPSGYAVADDVTQAIALNNCYDSSLINPIVYKMRGNATYFTQSGWTGNYSTSTLKAFPNFRTRGITGGGNDHVTISNPRVYDVDQAIDLSGNGANWGNKNMLVLGGELRDCGSVGLKWAGAHFNNKAVGVKVYNAGMIGFQLGGHSSIFQNRDLMLSDCESWNAGYNDAHFDIGDVSNPSTYVADAHCGFQAFQEHSQGIVGLRLVGCRVIDRQGFYLLGDDPYEAGGPQPMWPGAGATNATLQLPWTGYTGQYSVTFTTSEYTEGASPAPRIETRTVTLTNGETTCTWSGGLMNKVSHPFVSRPSLTRYGYLGTDNNGVRLPFDTQSKRPNTLENCESIGHTIAHSEGFHRDICHVKGTAPQSTSNNMGVAIKFPVVIEDTMAMLSVDERIYIKRPGVYRVRGRIAYDPGSNGYRAVEVIKNSSANPDAHKLPYATVSGEETSCPFDEELTFTQGDVSADSFISIEAEQTSGGSLNIRAGRWLKVERVRDL
ncbi:MAG: hypothetical protein ACO1QB_14155 [Verrucomicrobiales bacterium]